MYVSFCCPKMSTAHAIRVVGNFHNTGSALHHRGWCVEGNRVSSKHARAKACTKYHASNHCEPSEGCSGPEISQVIEEDLQHRLSDKACSSTTRRGALALAAASASMAVFPGVGEAIDAEEIPFFPDEEVIQPTDYSQPGPFRVVWLPRQEHTCWSCFPNCVGDGCLLRIDIVCPARGQAKGLMQQGMPTSKYPLAILTGGYLVRAEQYRSYAQHLASWGYVVVTYSTLQNLSAPLNDELCASFIRDIIDWANSSSLLRTFTDTDNVYLIGHSRGAKLSVLAAVDDPRACALCLIDPVDNTVYAPLGPGYPSALAALRGSPANMAATSVARPTGVDDGSGSPGLGDGGGDGIGGNSEGRGKGRGEGEGVGGVVSSSSSGSSNLRTGGLRVPIAIVAGDLGGDCAPRDANHSLFFEAASAPCWHVVLNDAGHLQFLDMPGIMERAICLEGSQGAEEIRGTAKAVLTAWGEVIFRGAGCDDSLQLIKGVADSEKRQIRYCEFGDNSGETLQSTLDLIKASSRSEIKL
eukprot:jgi/Mesvir1/13130/Mv06102-RA.1